MHPLLLGTVFVVLWASAFTAIRGSVPEWPPLWALAARFGCVAPIMLALVLWRRAPWPAKQDRWRLAMMGLFGSAGYLAGAWASAKTLPTGLIALLSATAPLFVAAGEVLFLRQRMKLLAWVGLALGWLGVAVLGLGGGVGGIALSGVLFALAGALSQSLGLLCFAPARGRVDPWAANAVQSTVGALGLLALAAVTEPRLPAAPSLTLVLSLAYSVLVIGVGAYALYFVVLQKLPASAAAALQLLAPPVAAVLGWAMLGEHLGWHEVFGGLITLAGLAVMFRARAA